MVGVEEGMAVSDESSQSAEQRRLYEQNSTLSGGVEEEEGMAGRCGDRVDV